MLVTSALPYANGPLHLGHLLEHIQTNIWVQTQKMLGHTCISICAEDAHGTPIMLKAEQLHLTPEALIAQIKISHEADFNAFGIHYEYYHTTHSEENRMLAEANIRPRFCSAHARWIPILPTTRVFLWPRS